MKPRFFTRKPSVPGEATTTSKIVTSVVITLLILVVALTATFGAKAYASLSPNWNEIEFAQEHPQVVEIVRLKYEQQATVTPTPKKVTVTPTPALTATPTTPSAGTSATTTQRTVPTPTVVPLKK